MLKRLLLVTLCAFPLAFFSNTFADGPYIGVGGGYSVLGGKFKTGETANVTENLMVEGGTFRGLVGYHMDLGVGKHPLWIAVEGMGEWSSNKVEFSNVEQLEALGGFGLSLRFGFNVESVAKPFLIGGWHATHFKSATLGGEKRWLNGGRYGVGVDVHLNNVFSLRPEWNQTRYQTWDVNSEDIRAVENQFVLSIVLSILG